VDIRTQEEQIRTSLKRERLFARLAVLVGGVTLLLVAIGVYGLLAYSVTRRTAEIGIRMALGTRRERVRWMILRRALLLTAMGVAIGIPAAFAGTKTLEALLFGLSPRDPLPFVIAAATMLIVAAAAAYLPARRASRVDPMVALRTE